jgi:hypothetical protein
MNCTACKHRGKCPVFENEKKYVEAFDADGKPVKELCRMFLVSKNGAYCGCYKKKRRA